MIVEKGMKFLLSAPEEWDAKAKIDNTLAYCKFIREHSLAFCSDDENQFLPIEMRSMILADGPPKKVQHGDEY